MAADLSAAKVAFAGMSVVSGPASQSEGAFGALGGSAADAQAASDANRAVITIGSDVGCVDAGLCVLVVQSQPKVTIFLSHSAAAKAEVTFDSGFEMLMTEH
jgi:hypothetical protein